MVKALNAASLVLGIVLIIVGVGADIIIGGGGDVLVVGGLLLYFLIKRAGPPSLEPPAGSSASGPVATNSQTQLLSVPCVPFKGAPI